MMKAKWSREEIIFWNAHNYGAMQRWTLSPQSLSKFSPAEKANYLRCVDFNLRVTVTNLSNIKILSKIFLC